MTTQVVLITGGLTGIGRADAVVFVASGKVAYITGQAIRAMGGKTAS